MQYKRRIFMADRIKQVTSFDIDAHYDRKRRDRESESGMALNEECEDFVSSYSKSLERYDPGRKKALQLYAKYSG